MKIMSFRELFLYILSDIYNVESQLVVEIPRLAKIAYSEELIEALHHHLEDTKNQVKRLEKVFKIMNETPKKVEWSRDIKALFTDTERFLKSNTSSELLDAAIILVAQRVEHFEIATYGTLISYAKVLELDDVKSLLEENLREEYNADEKLTKVATGGLFKAGVNTKATIS